MRNYNFHLFGPDGLLVGQGWGYANNAIEAFESACESGSIFMDSGVKYDVIATSESGLKIGFEAGKF